MEIIPVGFLDQLDILEKVLWGNGHYALPTEELEQEILPVGVMGESSTVGELNFTEEQINKIHWEENKCIRV